MKKGWIVAVMLSVAVAGAPAGETPLTDMTDVVANGSWDGANTVTLNPNANGYRVTSNFNTSWFSGGWQHANVILDSAGTSLYVNDLGASDNFELSNTVSNEEFFLGDGEVHAVGGLEDSFGLIYNGIQMERFTTLAGKSGNVYGISGENRGSGISLADKFIHEGSGTVTAQGGHLAGIFAFNGFETRGDSGDIIARGGGAGAGINVGLGGLTHAGTGKIFAYGATAVDSQGFATGMGISLGGDFETQGAAGDVHIEGGLTAGMLGYSFHHRGTGEVTAIGSDTQVIGGIQYSGNGISLSQDFNAYTGSGKVTATGVGDYGWGISATTMYVDSELEIARTASAESIYIMNYLATDINSVGITFGANSVLRPVVDFSKPDDLASGLIYLNEGTIKIEDGASLAPILTNTASIANGEERKIRFMEAGNQISPNATDAKIDGEFSTLIKPTLTFSYEMEAVKEQNDAGIDKTYYLKFGRINTPGGVVAAHGYCSDNTRAMLDAMEIGLAGVATPESAALNQLYDAFVGFTDPAELAKYATKLSLTSTPQQFSRLTAFSMRQTDSAQYNLVGNVAGLRRGYQAAAANQQYGQPQNWALWFDPLYHASWSHRAITCGFSDTNEKYGGASLGLGKVVGNLTLGGSIYYLRGKVDASGYDTDSDTYGFMASGRYDFLSGGETVVPWLQAYAGYGYHDYSQKRRDYSGNWHKSSPDAHLLRVGMAVGLDVDAAPNFLISPRLGVEYSLVDQGSYRESNNGDLGLSVRSKDYNSFRPYLGIELEGQVTDRLSLTGRATYRYEAGDKRARLSYNYVSVPTVAAKFKGEDVNRSSGSLGLGAKYRMSERASLGANYDLWLEDHYVGHQFGLSFDLAF